MKARFDWSDSDVAEVLGVTISSVSRWRVLGVPAYQMQPLRDLLDRRPEDMPGPRRVRARRG